ncbi:putative Isochorismatase-like superfamily [Dioscorea sansibarensis]
MQNDFIQPRSLTYLPGSQAIIQNVIYAVSVTRDCGIFVIWICIRPTVYAVVALDYQSVSVIADATAAATPEVQIGEHFHRERSCYLILY